MELLVPLIEEDTGTVQEGSSEWSIHFPQKLMSPSFHFHDSACVFCRTYSIVARV